VQRVEEHPTLGKAAKQSLAAFAQMMTDFHNAQDELHLTELIDRVAERSGLGPELREQPDGEERWSNVLELRRVAGDYTEIETHTALELFLENVALVGGADTVQTGEDGTLMQEENRDAVTLITLHAAKGLEYPIVFIVGMDEGSLPHSRSVDKPEQLEEERRLAYVGFTRAMRRLYLLRAVRRSYFGDVQPTEPSRFLDDIPLNLVSNSGAAGGRSAGGRASQDRRPAWDDDDFNQDRSYGRDAGRVFGSGKPQANRWTPQPVPAPPPASARSSTPAAPPPAPKPAVQRFKPGDAVRHDTFGEGTILKSEMVQGTEFVDVQFHGKHGKKRLSMDFARLEKI
jgi:DNA helicase II / ATP-dependent DNA helicase PcrA